MSTPIIILVGQAGTGKDTVASFIVKNHNAVAIAQADPMKQLGKLLFQFSEDQLWGPSDSRNAADSRFDSEAAWDGVESYGLHTLPTHAWLQKLFPGEDTDTAFEELVAWFEVLRKQTLDAGKPLTPRIMLQTLGTEWGRDQRRDLWSDYAIRTAFNLLGGGCRYDRATGLVEDASVKAPDYVVISDGRFRNEVVNVMRVGGTVIKIASNSSPTVATAGVAGHASEEEQKTIPDHFFSGTMVNDKDAGLGACEKAVGYMMHWSVAPNRAWVVRSTRFGGEPMVPRKFERPAGRPINRPEIPKAQKASDPKP